jgi:hypothetical protein
MDLFVWIEYIFEKYGLLIDDQLIPAGQLSVDDQ